jgi:hypothetical protein
MTNTPGNPVIIDKQYEVTELDPLGNEAGYNTGQPDNAELFIPPVYNGGLERLRIYHKIIK